MIKKTKENPLMQNNKKVKTKGLDISEDENEIKRFIIIVIVIAVISGIVYLATEAFNKHEDAYEESVTAGEINYNVATVGTLLNRPEEDYYVLVYNNEDKDAIKYSTLMQLYIQNNSSEKNYKQIYYCDLNNSLNSSYYNVGNDNKSNPKATKVKDFDFGDITLIEVKEGKVVKYIEDYTTIHDLLK